MISVEEIIEDDDLAQDYIIYRSQGHWDGGRWIEDTPLQIEARGTISVSSARDIQFVPEADRIRGAMTFHNIAEIYVTRNSPSSGTSDKIYWRGNWYKIIQVSPYGDYGYFSAIGVRIEGE